jgi:hypothetical protein
MAFGYEVLGCVPGADLMVDLHRGVAVVAARAHYNKGRFTEHSFERLQLLGGRKDYDESVDPVFSKFGGASSDLFHCGATPQASWRNQLGADWRRSSNFTLTGGLLLRTLPPSMSNRVPCGSV